MFVYGISYISRRDEFIKYINETGNVPDYVIVVAKGYGEPSEEVKGMMKAYYGFDHDEHEAKGK
jgi:hypothetical protein